jgi:predicted GNAT family acetyltransferase
MPQILEFSNAAHFLEHCRSFLLTAEATNNLLLSTLWTMAKSSVTRSARLNFFAIENNGRTCGAALNSTERRLLLSHMANENAAALGHELAQRQISIKRALGPNDSVTPFCHEYTKPQDRNCSITSRQKNLQLDKLLHQPSSPGIKRAAKSKDFPLLLKWSLNFSTESKLEETEQETADLLLHYINNKQLFIWENIEPVAMAGFGGITPNGVRVNMVYTPPTHRRHGYAGTLVHSLTHRLLAEGHRHCFLFVDAENTTALHLYEKLGYLPVCDFAEYRIES